MLRLAAFAWRRRQRVVILDTEPLHSRLEQYPDFG
jgi:hypothetical protein